MSRFTGSEAERSNWGASSPTPRPMVGSRWRRLPTLYCANLHDTLWITCTTLIGAERPQVSRVSIWAQWRFDMARNFDSLPQHFPDGTKYVVESSGVVVHRYVGFPDGRKISLPSRKAIPCAQAARNRYEGRSTRMRTSSKGLALTLGL